jgi:hypothetical protein
MKVFHCNHCDHLVFFENTQCVACGHTLAFLPDVMEMGSLEPAGETLRSVGPTAADRSYRLCQNYAQYAVCNWAVPADDGRTLCESCRLTRVIPDLTQPGTVDAWRRLEQAKRRVVYTLKNLGLPMMPRAGSADAGLAFHFIADDPSSSASVLTGHSSGTVTIDIAEADDAERERRRRALGEPYRTLLGHLRHETGHYYWDQLIANGARLEAFRRLFGDERADYGAALQQHYQMGPRWGWQDSFVSAYAGVHPWEDWAETWTHYLHMIDTMEMAAACGVSIRPGRAGEPALANVPDTAGTASSSFHRLISGWFPLTYVLNNLNRGMGVADAYPFVLSPVVVEKLRFVHDAVVAVATEASQPAPTR